MQKYVNVARLEKESNYKKRRNKNMALNYAKMKKDEIIWMANHKCKHSVSYLGHPNCYIAEHPDQQKTGFIDIEASQLRADWGITLSVAILDLHSNDVYSRVITKDELYSDTMDKDLLKEVVVQMRTYDRLIGYYASNMRFDIPFLRTRCVHHSISFPEFGEIVMEDLFPVIKFKFKLSSNRLNNACEALLGKTVKTQWLWKHWVKAIQGNQASLDYIKDHNIKDVQELKRLYLKVFKFSKKVNTSI